MYGRWSSEAASALGRADQAAERRGERQTNTADLLVALLDLTRPTQFMVELGVDVAGLRVQADLAARRDSKSTYAAATQQRSRELLRVLELGLREALSQGERTVNEVAMLLALARDEACTARRVLTRHGVTYLRLREQISQLLGDS